MIILIYPKYVGGKFIANCLALSRHCVIQNRQLAEMDMKLNHTNEKYYQFKLNAVMQSLPKKDDMQNWSEYEFGCNDLYGVDENFYENNSIKTLRSEIEKLTVFDLLKGKRESCLIAHDYRTLMKYLLLHRTAKIIEFCNFDQFRAQSMRLKGSVKPETYEFTRHHHYQDQEFYQLDSFMIDVDNTFRDFVTFSAMMEKLYRYMGFDDYRPEILYPFYSSYIKLHQ